ncbi:MAG: flagellar export chaperone FliS [Verrucomicrobiota bacterium]|jgi:flagellar protein FliS|nr:flagellar export chaperone FliS [Verrucomicrobiota bacterium]
MRYNPNPWQSYRQAATKTATPGQLVLMLFDGALRFLDRALIGFDLDDPLESNLAINNNILKAQDIIRELNASLNMELGGEFSATMRRLYNYYDSQLSKSNLQKDPTGVQLVIRLLTEIRNAWSEMLSGRSTSQVDQHADLQLQAA